MAGGRMRSRAGAGDRGGGTAQWNEMEKGEHMGNRG